MCFMKFELRREDVTLILDALSALTYDDILKLDDADLRALHGKLSAQMTVQDASVQTKVQEAIACRACIEKAIEEHFQDNRFDAGAAVSDVLNEFGKEPVETILASTIITAAPWDMSYSRENKMWARSVPHGEFSGGCLDSDPGLVNLFVSTYRDNLQELLSKTGFIPCSGFIPYLL